MLSDLSNLIRNAKKGDRVSQCRLGDLYERGSDIEKDIKEAIYWYSKAAEQGDCYAQRRLGAIYEAGDPPKPEVAFDWYKKAAEQGDDFAMWRLGHLSSDSIQKLVYFEKAGELGFERAYEDLVDHLDHDLVKKSRWIRLLAEDGNAEYQYRLGVLYEWGEGVPESIAEAIAWFTRSSDCGHIQASVRLAEIYRDISLSQRNEKTAFKYLLRAAKLGHLKSQICVARAYETGDGVSLDFVKARYWLETIVDGYYGLENDALITDAYIHLAKMYEEGIGGTVKLEDAYELYESSLFSYEMPIALFKAGFRYHRGIGTDVDLKRAHTYYMSALDDGLNSPRLFRCLGEIHEFGVDGVPDREKAIYFYEIAANKGDVDSQIALSKVHESTNKQLAYSWANVAAMTGAIYPRQRRDRLKKHLSSQQLEEAQEQSVMLDEKIRAEQSSLL